MAGKNRAPALIAALALVFLPVGTRAAGVDPYEAGIKQLSAKQFAQAGLSFQQAVKANPKNAMAFYYLALARHYQGDRSGAMNAYSRVISTFPGSQASSLALRGMASIDPSIMQKLGLSSAGGNSGSSAAPSGGGHNYGSNYTASSSSSS
ncbi:MAG TPA: tetratricopeptide repeat protein, partial [Candidatus Obscuribacter sp.]|nr:tetratricopeptide repeat protein [Candidatus Obscuribacter sp.]